MKGNKGEWSELYVLFKLLADGKLYAANEALQRLNTFYPVLSVLRGKPEEAIKYDRNGDIKIIVASSGREINTVTIKEFNDMATKLFENIKSGQSSTFEIPSVWTFAERCACKTLKASSVDKRDITLIVHDALTNSNPELGFSIKSRLGSPSTLLNAGKTTNFCYKIIGDSIGSEVIDEFNTQYPVGDTRGRFYNKFNKLSSYGKYGLEFIGTNNPVFNNNLVLIDSLMPNIMADIVKEFYLNEFSDIEKLTGKIILDNPSYLNSVTNRPEIFITYKIKEFLTAVALGMTPGTHWSGLYDATGGYIVVKEDGDVLCYHIYERNHFREYLFNNTKLDTPSSVKHDFGYIYTQPNGENRIKLNLQIRFK